MNYLDNGAFFVQKMLCLEKNPSMLTVLIKFEKNMIALHFLNDKCKVSSQIVIDVSFTTTCQVIN